MGNVVNLFRNEQQQVEPEPELPEKPRGAFRFAPREMWDTFTAPGQTGFVIDPSEVMNHTVTFLEVSRAFNLAFILTKDTEASAYFAELLRDFIKSEVFHTTLEEIPPTFRGYVWSPHMKEFFAVLNHLEYEFPAITGIPFIRHLFI